MTELESVAKKLRVKLLQMHYEVQAGHIGTGLSCIDLLTYVYAKWKRPEDTFILSKGHGASALYATLHEMKLLSDDDFKTYYRDGSLLPAHPAAGAFAAIPIATGSLGHGLSVATGIAFAQQNYLASSGRVTCLVSDGECNEGSVWEAALFAAHQRLANLTVVVDANGLQGFGRTDEVMGLEPLAKKWEAFGFDVSEINGHDFGAIHSAFEAKGKSKPRCVIARTVKGKGVSFMENKLEWHYLPVNKSQLEQALAELR